jgi:hypothetical protein
MYKNQEHLIILKDGLFKSIEMLRDTITILKYQIIENEGSHKMSITSSADNDDYIYDMILWFFFHGTYEEVKRKSLPTKILNNFRYEVGYPVMFK